MPIGSGYSSPSVAGDRLVFFHRLKDRETIECFQAGTGARNWQVDYPTHYEDRYGYNSGPRGSPIIEGNHVYTLGVQDKLHCLDLESGDIIWKRDLAEDFHLPSGFFGLGTSPLVEGDLLIVNIGARDGSTVVTFYRHTGEIAWKTGVEWGASYASPVPAQIHGQRRVFVFAGGESNPPSGGLLCIYPANGRIDFRFPWRSRKYESVNAASPVVIDQQVFISASYRTGGALVRISPDFGHKSVWQTDKLGTHFNTAIDRNGFLYGFDGRHQSDAALVCLDLESGREIWRFAPEWQESVTVRGQPRETSYGTFRGQMLWADGHFLVLGELGHLLWMDLSPKKHEILARAWLFNAQETWTPPVISGGLLYIVQNRQDMISDSPPRLLCYDLRDNDLFVPGESKE
jgi:outer membrane protein assembly factor BamB